MKNYRQWTNDELFTLRAHLIQHGYKLDFMAMLALTKKFPYRSESSVKNKCHIEIKRFLNTPARKISKRRKRDVINSFFD